MLLSVKNITLILSIIRRNCKTRRQAGGQGHSLSAQDKKKKKTIKSINYE